MRFRRRLSPTAKVDLVPMIDVVFQLVVFFMVSSTFIVTPGIQLDLPTSSTSESVAMSKLVVTLASDNEIYLKEKNPISLAQLDETLSKMSQEERESLKTVVLEGNKLVSYDFMIQVLDVLRKNGFKGVNLKTTEAK